MYSTKIKLLVLLVFLTSCASRTPFPTLIGQFRVESDLFLAQFDCKTDVDDILSVAGVATMLNDPRFFRVTYHAVAGTYGIQVGPYVPANQLFDISFGDNWSDAHSNYENALREVTLLATNTLKKGGNIWIAEAGQSDFSASLIRNIDNNLPSLNTKSRVHIVQHSNWNENSTTPDNLAYVRTHTSYHKIPDGNVMGNGSPGFTTNKKINWQAYITHPRLVGIWEMAFEIAHKYNGKDNRYKNPAIATGGMDFSDVSETCWIFGFNHLKNTEQFFKEFSSLKKL